MLKYANATDISVWENYATKNSTQEIPIYIRNINCYNFQKKLYELHEKYEWRKGVITGIIGLEFPS